MRSPEKRGFTLIELLVVIAIIAILASILFPVFAKAREQARKATCISQVRQIATAIQMYVQDNNVTYPGLDGGTWTSKVTSYLGSTDKMFFCPSDASQVTGPVSYAMAGILLKSDGKGVNEAVINSPSEVGVVCDATPSVAYSGGLFVGGGGSQDITTAGATPEPRHSGGTVAGYADGHAKYIPGGFTENDLNNPITRAFYAAPGLGLLNNPVATIPAGATIAGTGTAFLGGDYVASPIMQAAAMMSGYAPITGFKGYANTSNRPPSNYLWGAISNAPSDWNAGSAVAYTCIIPIVSRTSKLAALPTKANDTYVLGSAAMANLFSATFIDNSCHAYKMADANSETAYIKAACGFASFGTDVPEAANDLEMVNAVANDPYGIGYCAAAYFDPDRVTALSFSASNVYPSNSTKFRWVIPSDINTFTWPWKARITVPAANGTGTALQAAINGTWRTGYFEKTAYYKVSFWPGNAAF